MPIDDSPPFRFRLTLAGLVALAAAFALAARAGHGLTVDEPFMANSARLPWRELLDVFRTDNVPLPYVLLRAWMTVFGESELAVRGLSIAAYSAAVLLVGLAGRAAARPAAGLTGAMLMATSAPMGLVHAATARPYALLAFMAAAAMVQSLGLLRTGHMHPGERRWRIAALGATHLLGLWTHPIYVFIPAAAALASAAVHRRAATPDTAASGLALAAYLALWAPVLWATVALQPASWIQPPRVRDVQAAFLLLWGTGPGFMLIGALVAAGFSNRRRVRELFSTPAMQWLCLAAALAWLAPVLASFWKPVFVASRTPMLLLPSTALLAGAALSAVAGRAALVVLGAAFTLAAAQRVAAGGPGRDPVPTRASVAQVLDSARCGDTVVAAGLAHAPLEYYLRRLDAPSCIRYERFPGDMVNWTGRIGQLAVRRELEQDARDLSARLNAQDGRVWLFRLGAGMGHEASLLFERQLRASMACGDALPLRGAFFDGVVRCEARRATRSGPATPDPRPHTVR